MGFATIVQIIIGVIIVIVLYAVSMAVLRMDEAVQDSVSGVMRKQKRMLLDGYVDSSVVSEHSWNTVNQGAPNYVHLSRSFNRKGGAQFTYSFWLKMRNTDPTNIRGRTLMLRGDPRAYTWTKETKVPGSTNKSVARQTMHGVMIKGPRIRFGDTFDSLVVEFNTVANPDEQFVITPRQEFGHGDAATEADPSHRYNFIKLSQKRWTLYTFTFEDNVAINDFEDGVVVRFYINDELYNSYRTRGTLKQNNGNLYALPGPQPIPGANIGNLTYYNYAIGPQEVAGIFKAGPPKHAASLGQAGSEPVYVSEYNKLDVYNT